MNRESDAVQVPTATAPWLLFDIGNSRLKWSLVVDGQGALLAQGAAAHGGAPVATLDALPSDLPAPAAIWIANVTGDALGEPVAHALHARWGVTPAFARVRRECAGLVVAYEEPQRLGVDRWLAMLALWAERRGPFVVAGCGTALTFDAVDAAGQHLGGIIAPGLLTAQQAVLGATRFASGAPQMPSDDSLGRNTEACVRQGALHACAGLIERLARRHAGPDALRILTGGDAGIIAACIDGDWRQRDDLVQRGLLALAAA